jgi:nitrogen fixation NifU-like protein
VRLQLRVDVEGRIAEARFKAFGCSATIACASYVTERISGRPASEAEALGREQIARALALPPDRLHSAAIAEQALRGALAELRGRLPR